MKKILLLSTLFIGILTVFAHEYILVADSFRLKKGDNLEMHLFVSDGFNIQLERPINKTATLKFELITSDSTIDLSINENGTLPVISRKVFFEGGGLIHMERDYARITLATDKFMDYLKEDHIDGIPALVDKTKKEQKERYTRYIKSLVQSEGSYKDTLYKKITGQAFEIVLLQNPYTLRVGDSLKAKILFQGKPLSKKIITARNRTRNLAAITSTSRTNAKGICSFKMSRKGDWFLHATYMIPNQDKSDSDWESFWTSYSFGID